MQLNLRNSPTNAKLKQDLCSLAARSNMTVGGTIEVLLAFALSNAAQALREHVSSVDKPLTTVAPVVVQPHSSTAPAKELPSWGQAGVKPVSSPGGLMQRVREAQAKQAAKPPETEEQRLDREESMRFTTITCIENEGAEAPDVTGLSHADAMRKLDGFYQELLAKDL